MRPFKFFFMISIGIMLFFFLARVFVVALFFAAIMSLIFFAFRTIKNFFQFLSWRDYQYEYQGDFDRPRNFKTRNQENEFLFNDWDKSFSPMRQERIIKIN